MRAGYGDDPRRLFRPRRPEDFDALYTGTPPWGAAFSGGWRVDAMTRRAAAGGRMA